MSAIAIWAQALPAIAALALAAWLVATWRRNAGLVDIFWSLFFLAAAITYALAAPSTARGMLVAALVAIWAVRLAGYLAWRNWNAPEDHRYRAIRARNEPGFAWKSLYLVFGLQGLLAWLIAAPLSAAIGSPGALGSADFVGAGLVVFGITFEAVADAQLARFKAEPSNRGRVLDTGLWRYTRHPNYFGEFCVWWGFFAIAAGAGAAWTVFAPLLMSLLLLKVSGVALLERDIGERRPAYREYVARTNAFFPGTPEAGMRLILALATLAFALGAEAATRSWNFRVSLDGREIGRHVFTRELAEDGARVVSEARFDVRFLFLTAYRYEHRAEEQWRGDCLVSLEARTDDNGVRKDVRVQPRDCTWSFAYWDPGILRAERLLNAQTGEVLAVRSTALGVENIPVRGRETPARRHRLTAPGLSIDLWYAGAEWVALESSLEGGRRLRYELL